jgi:K+-transporting ATPase ATPase A chain
VLPILLPVVAALLSWPVGKMMSAAMEPAAPPGAWRRGFESALSRLGGRTATEDQDWKRYAASLLIFNGIAFIAAAALLLLQPRLPLNPDHRGRPELSLVFHTASSFVTNTNQQHYSGEAAMSYASQVFVLQWLQFVSAATGLAALAAMARALSGRKRLGNFYRDLARAVCLVFLPLAAILAVFLVLSGSPMTFHGAAVVRTLEGAAQTIARGPVAAMAAIKQLGTNGGGFFGANSAHPFENPTFSTNAVECLAILLLPMASVWMLGRITRRRRHAAVLFAVMGVLLAGMIAGAAALEKPPSNAVLGLPVAEGKVPWEGKELRFGEPAGPLWAAVTTAASNGSVDAALDGFKPTALIVPFSGMWLNAVFGGVGVGLINLFMYAVVGVFLCGMMAGRSPEYLGRKVETREMKLALLVLLLHPLLVLGGTAVFAAAPVGAGTVLEPGPRGYSEILYEFSSASANNGSGLEGLADAAVPWNIACGLVMLIGRFLPIVLPLGVAASLGAKTPVPETAGTLRTDGWSFGWILLGTMLLVGALLFLPAAVLGPIAEHLGAVR